MDRPVALQAHLVCGREGAGERLAQLAASARVRQRYIRQREEAAELEVV